MESELGLTMKKIFILLLFTGGLTVTCLSQASFEIKWDTEEDCKLWDAAIDNNGDVILVGDIGLYIGLEYDAFVMKVNTDGGFVTKRFILQDTVSLFSTIDVLNNGDYFITGSYNTQGNYHERDNLWIVILDQGLNLISQKSYKVREPYIGFGTAAVTLIDIEGNIALATIAIEDDGEEKTSFADFAFYKFNQQGDTLLSKYYHYIWDEFSWELKQMPGSDNMMLIERSTHYNNHDELMFLDPEFNILKINQFGNDDYLASGDLSSDFWLSDTTFLLSGGNSWDVGSDNEDYIGVYLADTSAVFHQELVLNKIDTADYPAWRNSMAYANDTTIYIGGFQNHFGIWLTDPTIVELYVIDKNMNLLGYKELGGDACYEVWGVIATDDDGCLVYGTRYDNETVPERDVHIWKVLREDINIVTGIKKIPQTTQAITVYPNPVKNDLFVHLPQGILQKGFELSIFTIRGKKVFQKKITNYGNLLSINLNNLQPGVYTLILTDNAKINYSTKIIKN